jgi:hypothetical protein
VYRVVTPREARDLVQRLAAEAASSRLAGAA